MSALDRSISFIKRKRSNKAKLYYEITSLLENRGITLRTMSGYPSIEGKQEWEGIYNFDAKKKQISSVASTVWYTVVMYSCCKVYNLKITKRREPDGTAIYSVTFCLFR